MQGLVERYLDREAIDRDRQGDKDLTEMGCIHMNKTVIVAKIVVIVDRTLGLSSSTTDAPSILSLSPSYVLSGSSQIDDLRQPFGIVRFQRCISVITRIKLYEHLEYMSEVSGILKRNKAVIGAGLEYQIDGLEMSEKSSFQSQNTS